MSKLFLIFSHTLTQQQMQDAKEQFYVEEFIYLPENLQKLWSSIPPELEDIEEYLQPLKDYVANKAVQEDLFLVQGDFGGCYSMVSYLKAKGFKVYYATTQRIIKENIQNGKVVKTSLFQHVQFREYK